MTRPLLVLLTALGLAAPTFATAQGPTSVDALLPKAASVALDGAAERLAAIRSAVRAASPGSVATDLLHGRRPSSHAKPDPIAQLVSAATTAAQQLASRDSRRTSAEVAVPILFAVQAVLDDLASRPPAGEQVAGCDLVDRLPTLCVGSEAANVYTANARVLVDLGGDDTYENSAGGAPVLGSDGTSITTSVVVDLAGNDTYRSPPGDVVVAQGAGFVGGIGVLADAAGDDRYEVDASGDAVVVAQGAGSGGSGFLFDLDGSDAYVVTGPPRGGSLTVVAQGAGQFCGADAAAVTAGCPTGVLADAGGDADRFELALGVAEAGSQRTVSAQGAANLGVGVLADDGGPATIRIGAGAALPGLDRYPAANSACPGTSQLAVACINAQGMAIGGGVGVVVSGSGDTRYEIDLAHEGMIWSVVRAQGHGSLHSLGAIDDAGGDDRYEVDVEAGWHRMLVADDDCSHPCAAATLAGSPSPGNSIDAQGVGALTGGVGAVLDHGGDDLYTIRSRQFSVAHLDDRRTDPASAATLDVSAYAPQRVHGQGKADGPGFGFLVDEAGGDHYATTVVNAVHASAVSRATDPIVSARTQRPETVAVQGVATGLGVAGFLLDLGGDGDRAHVSVQAPATATPTTDGARTGADGWPTVQGSWGGLFALLGTNPLATSAPSAPICETSRGARGFGQWHSCWKSSDDPEHQVIGTLPVWLHHGSGLVPQATGTRPGLTILAPLEPEFVPGGHLDVAARVGVPGQFVGETIHFSFQSGCTLVCVAESAPFGTVWRNHWEVDAVVGADGVAHGRLPTEAAAGQPRTVWRVYATFDGAAGAWPAHAEQRLSRVAGPSGR